MFKVKVINDKKMDMNSYLLIKNKQVIVIDPGFNGLEIINYIKDKQYSLEFILLTHGHFDHIRDIDLLINHSEIPIYIHKNDVDALYDPGMNYSKAFGSNFILSKSLDIMPFDDIKSIKVLNETIKIIHTPGHTFGSVMYEYNQYIFSGDTLFYDGIGRTDLFSGNFNAIRRSLNMIKTSISNNKTIYPGHGKSGKFKDIKESNRYLQ